MNVLVSGSHGLVGSALVSELVADGIVVRRLVRGERAGEGEVAWDPDGGHVDEGGLGGIDAVVHLAGENIAARRWSSAQKSRIRDSRVRGTRRLAEAVSRLAAPPGVMICASAIGYYGDRGAELLDESSEGGSGFLAEVCRDWERAAEPAVRRGVRVVWLRFGVILSARGGALKSMLRPFRLGLGGVVGSGRQFLSWVSLDDAVGAIRHALARSSVVGVVNVVAPAAVTNREFTRVLGRVLGRPTVLPLPAFAARLVLGEMADALLLSSARVVPRRLEASGYRFRHAELEEALRSALRG